MRVLNIAVLVLLLASISGCKYIPKKMPVRSVDQNQVGNSDAYVTIVLGTRFSTGIRSGNQGNLVGIGYVGYLDGRVLPNRDVLLSGRGERPASMYADTVMTDSNGFAYRIWKVKKSDVRKGKLVFYIYKLSNRKGQVVSGYRKGWADVYYTPVTNTSLAFSGWGKDKDWKFYKVSLTINKPGIYYLGDMRVAGAFVRKGRHHISRYYNFSVSSGDWFAMLVKNRKLGKVYDHSANWETVSGREFNKYLTGKF